MVEGDPVENDPSKYLRGPSEKMCHFCGLYCLIRDSETLSSESHN